MLLDGLIVYDDESERVRDEFVSFCEFEEAGVDRRAAAQDVGARRAAAHLGMDPDAALQRLIEARRAAGLEG